MPKVSIILPTYNGSKWIETAIKSVFEQIFLDWELIVIDDWSTDGVDRIVLEYAQRDSRIVYVKNERNLGIQKTLNKGLRQARGQYIARIDDDDEWSDPRKLEEQIAFLDTHPDYVLVGTGAIVIDESGKELFRFLNTETDEGIRNSILGKNCFTHCSVMFRKDAALRVGGYSEERNALHVEDYDLWLKLGGVGKMANLQTYSIMWRMRSGAISSKNRMMQFTNGIKLVVKFRRQYPGFLKGFFRSWIRLFAYGVFRFIPILKLKYFLFKIGKER